MKKCRPLGVALLCAALLCACGQGGAEETAAPGPAVTSDTLYVKQVENLPEDFILGMDVSSVLSEEESGVKYYDFDGQEADLFRILAGNGVTHVRVRVWNDPHNAKGQGYGGGNNDAARAAEIGKRAAQYGLKLIVDFHYSDFWADPGKQMVPKAWAGMEIEEKSEAAYQYTRETLETIQAAGGVVGMVQVGNETNGALCGEKRWAGVQAIMAAGSRAVREVCPDALVAVHFANPEKEGAYLDYAWRLSYYSVDYDVFATSYYPYWHGTLDNLAAVLSEVAETYGKKTMVMETSYAFTGEDTDFSGNTIGDGSLVTKDYPYTVQGQANSVRNIIDTVANKTRDGIGVCYWEGAWITVGTNSWEENHALWEAYGSGWASSYASEYDPADAGRYYGGSAVDNQAFFDAAGHPLESLKVFALVREGNEAEVKPDAIADTSLMVDLNGTIVLPETVDAVMTDDSRQAVSVVWDVTEADLAKMYAGGAATYEISGTAGDLPARCCVTMMEFNFLKNYSFEDGETGWTATDLGHTQELYVEEKATDSLTGVKHYHFWSAAAGSVEFTLEQTVEGLSAGDYTFSISIMGGDAGTHEVYAYVKEDGQIVATAPMKITSYGEWDTGIIENFSYAEGQTLAVGIYVRCMGEGAGAWGKIDDAMLNSVG